MEIISLGYGSVYDENYSIDRAPDKGEHMLLLTRSRGSFVFDGISVILPAETLILYNDTVNRTYSAFEGAFICDWICFSTESDSEFIDSLNLIYNRPICAADPDFVNGLIRNICNEYYSINVRRPKLLDGLMRSLLSSAEDFSDRRGALQQTAVEPHYAALIELRAKIYRNPQLKWNVDTMAADVNMSRSYLQHIYREVFGVSCISDVISSKIEKAKEILSETSCTVSQVASMCGYDNEEHFMRQFKKVVGVTPTRYRKSS